MVTGQEHDVRHVALGEPAQHLVRGVRRACVMFDLFYLEPQLSFSKLYSYFLSFLILNIRTLKSLLDKQLHIFCRQHNLQVEVCRQALRKAFRVARRGADRCQR